MISYWATRPYPAYHYKVSPKLATRFSQGGYLSNTSLSHCTPRSALCHCKPPLHFPDSPDRSTRQHQHVAHQPPLTHVMRRCLALSKECPSPSASPPTNVMQTPEDGAATMQSLVNDPVDGHQQVSPPTRTATAAARIAPH